MSLGGGLSQIKTKIYPLKSTRRNIKSNKFAFEPLDNRIDHVNIDERHQYRVSVAEAQTSLAPGKMSQGARSEEKRLFSRARKKN